MSETFKLPPSDQDPVRKRHHVARINFEQKGYFDPGGWDFFNQLQEVLIEREFNPRLLVYSGFNGDDVGFRLKVPEYPIIYGMNFEGWEQAIRCGDLTPATYAVDGYENPVIGLYDINQLVEAHYDNMQVDDNDPRIQHTGNIHLGWPIVDFNSPYCEGIAHIELSHNPKASPTWALQGLVYVRQS